MTYTDELKHFGVRGMKWGVRRFQNEDGSLTPAGKKRYKVLNSDIKTYGRRGAKRIAVRMDTKGVNRAAARRYERDRHRYGRRGAERIDRAMKKKNYSHSVAKANEELRRAGLAFVGTLALTGTYLYVLDHPKKIAAGAKKAARMIDTFQKSNSIGRYKDIFEAEWREVPPSYPQLGYKK